MVQSVKQKHLGLQSLKFLCAMVVFLSHSLMLYRSDLMLKLWDSPAHLFFDGRIGVAIFFVLSGYFYYTKEPLTLRGYGNKVRRKLLRIWPMYIVATLAAYALYMCHIPFDHDLISEWGHTLWPEGMGWRELVKQLFFQCRETNYCFDPVMWYMQVEFKMLFLLPVVVGGCRWTKQHFVWVLLVLFVLSWRIQWLPFFIWGVLLHWLTDERPEWLQFLYDKRVAAAFIVAGLCLVNIQNYRTEVSCYEMIQLLGIALILLPVVVTDFSVMRAPLLVKGGDVSYEIYLVHLPLLLALRYFGLPMYLFVPLGLTVSLVAAVALHQMSRLWER